MDKRIDVAVSDLLSAAAGAGWLAGVLTALFVGWLVR